MSFWKRLGFSAGVAVLAAALLPWGPTASAEEEPAYTGYTSTATASVVRLDIYEPTIPVPASPEMELHFAYTKAFADSSTGKGRASWMWPGDPVGEGLKVIVEQAGLPPQLGAKGYPIQVNSAYPNGPETHTDEPSPGSVMRTTSTSDRVVAKTGFSPDGETQDPEEETSDSVGLLQEFGQVITGQQPTEEETEGSEDTGDGETPAPPPSVPDPLKVLIDIGGYESTSQTVNTGDAVTATSRAALGDIALLGGLVTMSGLETRSQSSSNGVKGVGDAEASYGVMRILGKKFRFGPDGFEAAGNHNDIPGLPDNPTKALEALGIRISFPKPTREVAGDAITTTLAALELTIDLDPLTKLLNTQRINDILGPIIDKIEFPEQAAPLKSLLGALGNLSPKFVVTLASARSSVDTVQGIEVPELPPVDTPPVEGPGAGPGGGSATPSTGGGSTVPSTDTAGEPTTATPDLVSSTPGLPELFSFPGLLLVAGIAAASLLGSYLRRLGLLVLGAGAACAHGLESGVPDLRKVT